MERFIGTLIISGIFFFICLLITAMILRWFFRINTIVARLDRIVTLLEGTKGSVPPIISCPSCHKNNRQEDVTCSHCGATLYK